MNIKNNIEYLFKLNVSNYQISKDTKISQMTLSKYATGKSELGNMTLDNAIKLNDYYNKIKGEIEMKTYTNYFTIDIEVNKVLEVKIQEDVYKVRNSDLDYALKQDIDAFAWIADEIDQNILEHIDNDWDIEEIESAEYTRINKDTNENEIVKIYINVKKVDDDNYKVNINEAKCFTEPL